MAFRKPVSPEQKRIKAEDRLIDQIYRDRCTGMQISVMRIPELFCLARASLRQGKSIPTVGDEMAAFVEQEKL